jgi:hypothetical protein
VITAVSALGATLIYSTDVAGKAVDWLGTKFGTLKNDAVQAYQGIADAMAAGDMALAAKILWLTLKMEWTRGVNVLEKAWLNFKHFFVQIAYDAFDGARAAWEMIQHGIRVGMIEIQAAFKRLGADIQATFKTAQNVAFKTLAAAYNKYKSLTDESWDAQAFQQAADDEYNREKNRIEGEKESKKEAIDQNRQTMREAARQDYDSQLEQIAQDNIDRHRTLDEAYAERMAENANELDAARKAWKESLQKARDKRREKDIEKPSEVDRFKNVMDIGSVLSDAARKMSVTGTFNATAAWGLGTGSAADRTAKATEDTARNTKKLLDESRNNGATFS